MLQVKKRGSRSYLYRVVKVKGKVIYRYIGAEDSPQAKEARYIYEELTEIRIARKKQKERIIKEENDEESILVDLFSAVTKIMKEALKEAGYHQHDRGEWRKRRNRNV